MNLNAAVQRIDVTGGLNLTGTVSGSAGSALIKEGANGTLTVSGALNHNGPTVVAGGTLILASSGTLLGQAAVGANSTLQFTSANGILRAPSVFIAEGTNSKLDLGDGDLIVDYTSASPQTAIRGYIGRAYAAGAFTGAGLTSSAAQATGATTDALGYAEAADLGIANFRGQPVDATTVIVNYTLAGDANLDGTVDTIDFARLVGGFATAGVWSRGDFNYDAVVNSIDFNSLVATYGQTAPAGALPLPGAVVPEPAMIGLMALGALARRRKRR